MTDCNNCKHETECNHNKRYDYKNKSIVDYQTDKDIESYSEIADLLNSKEEEIKGYKELLHEYIQFNPLILLNHLHKQVENNKEIKK